jgi:CRP/FNR family transcriptional regulator
MLDQISKSRLLLQYPMLGQIPIAIQNDLLATATLLQIPAGAIVFDEQQLCQGFPMLLSGTIRVFKASHNGRELQLYRVVPGESCILTSSCLLGNTRYQARGVAEQALVMVLLPVTSFNALLANHDTFRLYIFNLFSERLTDLMQLVSAVAFQKLDQRLATLLISMPNPIHITHQALADELGSVREMISRLLKNFSEQGWIKLGREQIDIINPSALKKFAAL